MNQYKVTSKNLFLRRGPNQKTSAIKLLTRGDTVSSDGKPENGWLYVNYQGMMGYLPMNRLEEKHEAQYDDDSIGAALETALSNIYAALDELKEIIKAL